jgi:hypothetical protein
MSENDPMLSRAPGTKTEIRLEVEKSELSVLDGFCSAHDISRTSVIRDILKAWSDKQSHVAIVICRVAGINPYQPESNRND